jgi:hypothetical protein
LLAPDGFRGRFDDRGAQRAETTLVRVKLHEASIAR